MAEVIVLITAFQVQAQDLVRVCARAERESQDRQNKYSHHLGVRAERGGWMLSVMSFILGRAKSD